MYWYWSEINQIEKASKLKRRLISQHEAQNFANRHNMHYIETSAKTGVNVDESFKLVADKIVENIKTGRINPKNEVG